MAFLYPQSLLGRLEEAWRPPHWRPLNGATEGQEFSSSSIAQIVDAVYFASLRTEEGRTQELGIVLVQSLRQLATLNPPWHLNVLGGTFPLDAERLAKVASLAADDRTFIVVSSASDKLEVVGFGYARESGALLAADRYPRIRVVAPGDLVFYRGDTALFRYKAGEVEELRPDFFVATGEPRAALMARVEQLFPNYDQKTARGLHSVIGDALSRCIRTITRRGSGGLIALLAPGEERPASLTTAAMSYPLNPVPFGEAIVEAFEQGAVMAQVEQSLFGAHPTQGPHRAVTEREIEIEAAWRDSREKQERIIADVGAMGSVDGAVLVGENLTILGFGCKLPGIENALPDVFIPPTLSGDELERLDLTARGTRHAAAALFAAQVPGRLALTVSSDGPAGCFMWSETHECVLYWPVHVGVFAPTTWDTA